MRLEDYMKELQGVELLEPDEEAALWRAYKSGGDMVARRQIIESYQPLVFKQAMPYRALPGIMDVIQEGTVGLIEAVERYDPARGVAFSLFAVHRIRGRMLDFLRREGRVDIACMEEKLEDASGTLKENLIDTSASVTEQAESHELSGKLHQAMERLPAKERAVLEGMYLRSEGAAQMADSLQVSSSHIYRLQKSGIRRVRGMLSRFMQYW